MKKTILASTIAALSVVSISAQAMDKPSVYGEVNLSAEYVDDYTDNAGNVEDDTTLKSRDSFVGFKGSEGLDNGLSVVYDAQIGFEYDSQSSDDDFELRKGMLGLEGATWGVSAGRLDNPYVSLTKDTDAFDNTLAETATVFSTDGFERTDKSIGAHLIPVENLTLRALVAMDADEEVLGVDQTFDAYALTAQYDMEVATVFGGYQNVEFENDDGVDSDSYKLGAGFKPTERTFMTLAGERTEIDEADLERDALQLQGVYALNQKVNLKAGVGFVDLDSDVISTSGNVYALGADYAVGKNTTISATLAQSEADEGVVLSQYVPGSEEEMTGLSLGISHRF